MSIKLTTLDQFTMLATRVKTEIDLVDAKIPTAVSQLPNDANYITQSDLDMGIASAGLLAKKIVENVDAIDTTAPDATKYIYLVPTSNTTGTTNNTYDEYMVISGALEKIGDTKVDLTGYLQSSDAATDAEVTTALNTVFGVAS